MNSSHPYSTKKLSISHVLACKNEPFFFQAEDGIRDDECRYTCRSPSETASSVRTFCGVIDPYQRPGDGVVPHRHVLANADDVDAADLLVSDFGQIDRYGNSSCSRPMQCCRRKHDAALKSRARLAFNAQCLRSHVRGIEQWIRVFTVGTILERAPERDFSPRI